LAQVVALLHNAVGPRATKDIVEWLLGELAEEEEARPGIMG